MIANVIRHFGLLAVGKILGDLFLLGFFVYVTRVFGQEGIGQYSFAMAVTSFFAGFAQFGLYTYFIKEASQSNESSVVHFGRVFLLRLLLTLVMYSGLCAVVSFLPVTSQSQTVILLVGAYQLLISIVVNGFGAIFVAQRRMHWASALDVSVKTMCALSSVALIALGYGLIPALSAFPGVTLAHLVVVGGIIRYQYRDLKLLCSVQALWSTFKRAVPYAWSTILYPFRARVDVVFLGLLMSESASGIYNVAFRLVFVYQMFIRMAEVALLPTASSMYKNAAREEFVELYHRAINLLILVGVPAACGTWLIAPKLLHVVFGPEFVESVAVLRILSWLVFLASVQCVIGSFLTACDQEAVRAKTVWLVVIMNIVGNAICIPIWGIQGAAIATVLSETAHIVLLLIKVSEIFGAPKCWGRLGVALLASAAFVVPFSFWPGMPIGLVIPVSMAVYVAFLASFGDIREHEGRMLLELFKKRSQATLSSTE